MKIGKIIMRDKWVLVGFYEPLNMYAFVNRRAFIDYNDIEVQCVSNARYMWSDADYVHVQNLRSDRTRADIPVISDIDVNTVKEALAV